MLQVVADKLHPHHNARTECSKEHWPHGSQKCFEPPGNGSNIRASHQPLYSEINNYAKSIDVRYVRQDIEAPNVVPRALLRNILLDRARGRKTDRWTRKPSNSRTGSGEEVIEKAEKEWERRAQKANIKWSLIKICQENEERCKIRLKKEWEKTKKERRRKRVTIQHEETEG